MKTRADKESSFSTESERGGQKIEKKGGSDARVRNEAPLHEGAKGLGRDRSTERERGEGRKTIKKRESDARVRHAAPLRDGAKGRCEGASRIVVALQLLLHPLRVALVRAWAAANRIHELTHVSGLPGPCALLGLVQRLYHSLRSLLLFIFTTPLGCVSTLLEVMLKLRWVLVPLAIQMLMQVRYLFLFFCLFPWKLRWVLVPLAMQMLMQVLLLGWGLRIGHGAVIMRRKAVVISEATYVPRLSPETGAADAPATLYFHCSMLILFVCLLLAC